MKKNILLLMSLICMAAGAQAGHWCAQDSCYYDDKDCVDEGNFYVRVLGGPNFLQKSRANRNISTYQTGYMVAGSLGYRFCHGLRLEAEYAYRRNGIEKIHFCCGQDSSSKNGHFQTSSAMANLLWDLPVPSCDCEDIDIRPYVGAGVGYDFQEMDAKNSRIAFNQRWNHFSWQLMAGLACPVFRNTDVILEYKFHQDGCHFNNHSIGVGILYNFSLFR